MNILFLGDYCPAFSQTSWETDVPGPRLGQGFVDRVGACDMSVVNLECPLTLETSGILKTGPVIRANPGWIKPLVEAGVSMVTLANNHILDCGSKGLADTLAICREHRIGTMGAGENLGEAQQIHTRSVGDKTVALINVCEEEWSVSPHRQAGAAPLDIIENVRRIKAARAQADHVAMIVHAGNEMTDYPPPSLVQSYRFFIEQGADAVIAHHSHCVQGYEIYQEAPIVYSLGNFFFPRLSQRANARWGRGSAVELMLPFTGVDCLRWHPYRQCVDAAETLEWDGLDEQAAFAERLAALSEPLRDHVVLERLWRESLEDLADSLLWCLGHGAGRLRGRWRALLRRLGLGKWMRLRNTPSNRIRLNLLRAQSLRELLISRLECLLDEEAT